MKLFFLYFSSFLVIISLRAQVTIGALIEPQSGYLLELRERTSSALDPDTYNGLGLPKVKLIDLTTLAIDAEDKKDDYVGVMVYNMKKLTDATTDPETVLMEKGVYIWNGVEWSRLVHTINRGIGGQVLGSLGDGKVAWRDYYQDNFYKPTYHLGLEPTKAVVVGFSYDELTEKAGTIDQRPDVRQPDVGVFDRAEVYKTDFYTLRNTEKIMDLTFSVKYKLNNINNVFMLKNVWVEFEYDVYINKEVRYGSGSYKHKLDFTNLGVTETTLNYALGLPVKLPLGQNELSILIRVKNNTLKQNVGESSGQFLKGNSPRFFSMQLTDLDVVLYEK